MSGPSHSTPVRGLQAVGCVVVVIGHTLLATRLLPFIGGTHVMGIVVSTSFAIAGFLVHRPFAGRALDRHVTEIADGRIGSAWTTVVVLASPMQVAAAAWSWMLHPTLDRIHRRWSDTGSGQRTVRSRRPASAAIGGTLAIVAAGFALVAGQSPLEAHGGPATMRVEGVRAGDVLTAEAPDGQARTAEADETGTAVLLDVEPGRYRVDQHRGGRWIASSEATVTDPGDPPDPSWYRAQRLAPGTTYLTTRDGTQLAAQVHLPGPESEGPYPTVVELSGYRIADPGTTQPATAAARALGYATVSVNVRGTGCSAGAFDLLGPTGAADGYDVVEIAAAQTWAQDRQVGLVGFSYSAMTALHVAATRPPSLVAVAALATYLDAREMFLPGGLPNGGFPVGWVRDMQRDAEPTGTDWVAERIAGGDETCRRNQRLHGHHRDVAATYTGAVADDGRYRRISPGADAARIAVPTFLVGMLHDAIVGNDLASGLDDLTGDPTTRLVLAGGPHGDAVAPQIIRRLEQFLALHVAGKVPTDPIGSRELIERTRGDVDADILSDGPPLPLSFDATTDLAAARERYARAEPVEVLLGSGAAEPAGAAAALDSLTFATWPPPADAERWTARAGGVLVARPGEEDAVAGPRGAASFELAPEVADQTIRSEGVTVATPGSSDWPAPRRGTNRTWTSPPAASGRLIIGRATVGGTVRLAGGHRGGVQAVLSEVTSTGEEIFIDAGWQRVDSPRERISIELGDLAHPMREGSSLRLQLGTPGGGQTPWSFRPEDFDRGEIEVALGGEGGLALELTSTPDDLRGWPRCDDLRGQPCRRAASAEP